MSRRLRTTALSASLVLLLLAAPAAAYEISKAQSSGKELRWTSLPMKFNIESASLPGLGATQCQAAIRAAYKAWTGVSCSIFSTTDLGVTQPSANNTKDHINTHRFPSSWVASFPQNALAFTQTVYDPSSGKILDADVLYNPTHTWSSSGSFQAYDLQSVPTHEIGHEMGFGHSAHATATMYYATPNGATHQRSLHSDDIAAACYAYGNGSTLPPECTTQAHCATGETCTGGKCVPGAVTKKAYGAACSSSSDCTSNLCIQSGGKGTCSQYCASSACPSGDSCVGLSGGGKACLPGSAANAKELGQSCQSSIDCKSKMCVTWNGAGVCTHKCDVTAQNCANGFACTSPSMGGLCFVGTKPPKDPPKPQPTKVLGETCSSGDQCKSGLCAKTSAGQVCITQCEMNKANACPQGFMCEKMANNVKGACVKGTSGNTGNTTPPKTGGNTKKALGATCSEHSECQSALCITDGSVGKVYCSRLCQPATGCGQGWTCIPAGGGKHVCKKAAPSNPTNNAGGPAGPEGYEDEMGGCNVAPEGRALPLMWGVILLLVLALRPRRRSR